MRLRVGMGVLRLTLQQGWRWGSCKAGNLSLVLLCQTLELLPATVSTKEAWQAEAHQDSVGKAWQAGSKGTFLLLSSE